MTHPFTPTAKSSGKRYHGYYPATAMRADGLTERQFQVYEYVRACIQSGMPPTIREVMDALGFSSPNGVKCHFVALREKGFLEICPKRARHIKLTEKRPA